MTRNNRAAAAPEESTQLTLERIRTKALELFADRGFARVGMRELASHVGLGVGGFYYYFKDKEAVLFELLDEFHDDLLTSLDCEFAHAPPTLECALRAHLRLHVRRRREFTLVEHHLGELSPPHLQVIRRQQNAYAEGLTQLAAKRAGRQPCRWLVESWVPLLGFLRALYERLEDTTFREETVVTMGLEMVDQLFTLANVAVADVSPRGESRLHSDTRSTTPLAQH